jgi:hypothetical protein
MGAAGGGGKRAAGKRTAGAVARAPRFWIGIASRDHVRRGVAGGFCQLGHGKAAPIRRLSPGDWIAYYSPRESFPDGAPLQAFTAIGEVQAGEPYAADMGDGFMPTRRDVRFRTGAKEAPIRPLLEALELTRGKAGWGALFRRGLVEVSAADFARIAAAMAIRFAGP